MMRNLRHAQREARRASAGFSLIELVISIGILMTLTMGVAVMLRGGFEVKEGVSQKSKVLNRLSVAMEKLADDISHAILVSPQDQAKNGLGRRSKTFFKIEKVSGSDKLALTTRTHRVMKAGVNESDMTYVVYELREARDVPGRKHLYRGSAGTLPEDARDEPPMRVLARNIKNMTFEYWTGDRWSKEYWDTNRGDTRNKLPKLVRITLEAWAEDRYENDGLDESADQATDLMITTVYLNDSWEYAELKEQVGQIKWSAF
jgi:type II secretion system protein J